MDPKCTKNRGGNVVRDGRWLGEASQRHRRMAKLEHPHTRKKSSICLWSEDIDFTGIIVL